MQLEHDTWVAVADGEKALLLRNQGDAEYPYLRVISKDETENPPSRELGTDRPGRMPDNGDHGRSGMDETDWHRAAEREFAREFAAKLVDWANEGRFRHLVVCADPRTLGALRDGYGDRLKSVLVAELDKDLTNLPVTEMQDALKRA